MSPQDMADMSRCQPNCPQCANTATAKRNRRTGWILTALAWIAIIASWPADGVPGVVLAVTGLLLLWRGWFLVVRRGGTR